jgi:hypothetical protein
MLHPDPNPDSMNPDPKHWVVACQPCEPRGFCNRFVHYRKNTCFYAIITYVHIFCNKISRMSECVGKTKVFLRSCVHEPLEERRRQVLRRSATLIQKIWRGVHQCRRYRQIRQAAKRIQVSDRIVPPPSSRKYGGERTSAGETAKSDRLTRGFRSVIG